MTTENRKAFEEKCRKLDLLRMEAAKLALEISNLWVVEKHNVQVFARSAAQGGCDAATVCGYVDDFGEAVRMYEHFKNLYYQFNSVSIV